MPILKYAGFLMLAASLSVSAKGAGEYWYTISERCEPLGPTDEEARDAITPAVVLFEIVPAGISDYYIKVNNDALESYTEEGKAYLDDMASLQAYTIGKSPSSAQESIHGFMLQREAIELTTLVQLLSSFSQMPSDIGYYYKQLLKLDSKDAKFKAVTRAEVIDTGAPNRLLLNTYQTDYFLLTEAGKPEDGPFITVDHKQALSAPLHDSKSPWFKSLEKGLCGEKPVFEAPVLN